MNSPPGITVMFMHEYVTLIHALRPVGEKGMKGT